MAKKPQSDEMWAHELVRRIGAAMRTSRKGRSAKWLSDRTAELGYRVSPTVIAKLDSGHRGDVLSVAELVVLAAALDTAPITLLYPGPYDDIELRQICSASPTEVIPGVVLGDYLASQWFSALLPWTEESIDPGKLPKSRRTYARNVRALRKAREIAELHSGLLGLPEEGESPEEFLAFQSKVRGRIDELRAELAELQAEADDDA